jgi:predicted DNA-binding mobile mystery protein A
MIMAEQISPEALARKHLDAALLPFREAGVRPPRGWIRAIRNALGMTALQLAQRMGVAQPTLAKLERSEEADSISLKSLRHAAAALDCELIYAFVPKTSLQEIVTARARARAQAQLERTNHSMRLENQAVRESELAAELDRLTALILDGRASRLWESQ